VGLDKTMIDEKLFSLEFDAFPLELESQTFPHGDFAFSKKMKKKKFEERLEELQIELVKLQKWVRANGERIAMVFEGRDAAGKGGTIKRFTANLNPRYARTVALAKPSDVERGQWYFQRYVQHMPTDGEMVFFDRSWYNRSGVERVMGFCSEDQVQTFFQEVPVFEGMMVRDGIYFFKFWLTVSRAEQLKRFYERKNSPLKNWKLSPMDEKAVGKWDAYSKSIADQLNLTSSATAPWTVIDSNDQRRARLAAIQTVLSAIDYDGKDDEAIGEIDPRVVMEPEDLLDHP
jgi:polyphosphate kinase 2